MEQVKLAARLYQCQDSAKTLFQEQYHEKIKCYIEEIESVQSKFGMDSLQAAMALCQLDSVKDNGMAIMLFMAAAVEIIEPTQAK